MLYPVCVLHISERLKVIDIVRMIVICVEHAALVKAFDQHALSVEVAETERTVDLVHPLLLRPVLDSIEKCL